MDKHTCIVHTSELQQSAIFAHYALFTHGIAAFDHQICSKKAFCGM